MASKNIDPNALHLKKNSNTNISSISDNSSHKISNPPSPVNEEGDAKAIKCRYVVTLMGFLIFFVLNTQRLNMSIAIVAMVNDSAIQQAVQANITTTSCSGVYHQENKETAAQNKVGEKFDWSPKIQGYILGAGYLGYILTQILGGRFAEILGSKTMLIFGTLLASVSNLISPIASSLHSYFLIGAQLAKGLGQGILQPAMGVLMANWFPKNERGLLSSIIFCGFPAGALVGGLASGGLCDTTFLGGWPSVFYVFGSLGILVCGLLAHFLHEKPTDDPRISNSEKKYILSNQESDTSKEKPDIPWKGIFKATTTYSLFIAMFGQYWLAMYFLSVHPTYMGTILNYPITENGFLSSVPYVLQGLAAWFASWLSDWINKKGYAGVDTVRKACNTASCIGFALCLGGVYLAGCDSTWNNVFFILAIGCVGFGFPGSLIVSVDMSPTFAGTLMGISSTVASLAGFIIPVVVGTLTDHAQTLEQWHKIFIISIVVSLGTGIIFLLFGSADVQPWSKKAVDDQLENADSKDKIGPNMILKANYKLDNVENIKF